MEPQVRTKVAQRRDALLLRLLKTPPQSRAELAEAVRRAKGKKAYSDSREARQRGEAGVRLRAGGKFR
jgi:hypothetical protein